MLTPPDVPAPVARSQAPAVLPAAASPLTPPPAPDPILYWDAELRLTGASLDTGVGWDEVYGAVACRGRYEGTHVGLVRGNVYLDRAVIARQPVTTVQGRVQVLPQQPDPARPGYYLPPTAEFQSLSGNLFVIRMTKENGGEIRYRPEPVPVVTEPARLIVERLRRLREARPAVP